MLGWKCLGGIVGGGILRASLSDALRMTCLFWRRRDRTPASEGGRYKRIARGLALASFPPSCSLIAEAMRAAWLLKVEYGLETRVVNVHGKTDGHGNGDQGGG